LQEKLGREEPEEDDLGDSSSGSDSSNLEEEGSEEEEEEGSEEEDVIDLEDELGEGELIDDEVGRAGMDEDGGED
jgi:hypothetical protein